MNDFAESGYGRGRIRNGRALKRIHGKRIRKGAYGPDQVIKPSTNHGSRRSRLTRVEDDMFRKSRTYVAIAALWCASLFLVAFVASGQAQAPAFRPLPEPKVMAGPDVGFQVEGFYGDLPSGSVVVRVKGEWVAVHLGVPPRNRP
jgi:hypothetical protein